MQEKDKIGLNMIVVGSAISIVCLGLSFGLLFFNNINFFYDSVPYILALPTYILFMISFFGGVITIIGIALFLTRNKEKELILV